MRQISLTEFSKIIQEVGIQSIIFDSLNQSSCILSDVSICGEFNRAVIVYNPNRIFFSNAQSCSICFNRVRSIIDYEIEADSNSAEYGIICRGNADNHGNVIYRIHVVKSK